MKPKKPKPPTPLQLAECEALRLQKEIANLKASVDRGASMYADLEKTRDYWRDIYHQAERRAQQGDRERDDRRWRAAIWFSMGAALGAIFTIGTMVMIRPPSTPASTVTIQSPIPVAVSGGRCWNVDGMRRCADHITTSAPDTDNKLQVSGWDKAGALLWSVTGVRTIEAANP